MHDKRIEGHDVAVRGQPEAGTSTDISFASIIKGTTATPLTVFERKAALINAEMDKFGMGRYQWCIWFLCGFGYFLDLAWAQGVGVLASAVYQEMGVASEHWGDIFSCSNAGLAVGALFWGIMVDVIGRKWAFNLTCLITSVFGMLIVSGNITRRVFEDLINLAGRSQVQLCCCLRHLLALIHRPWWEHPDRCYDCFGVLATEPPQSRSIAFAVAATWSCSCFCYRLGHCCEVQMRS